MLKIFILCLGLSAATVSGASSYVTESSVSIPANSSANNDETGRRITVYKLTPVGRNTNAASAQAFDGYYNKEKNELKVGRFTYSVTRNMAYGQDNDYRAAYRYRAGDYYFNL